MNIFLGIVIHTANILGIFVDPFEFEGDYGTEVNPIRQQVFERVVSKEAQVKYLSDTEVLVAMPDSSKDIEANRKKLLQNAIEKDKVYGPTLSQLIPLALLEEVAKKHQELQGAGCEAEDFERLRSFVERYGDQKVFHFLRHNPSELLKLDKILRDKAAREGKNFDLPILGSTEELKGKNRLELKKNLLDAVFTEEILKEAQKKEKVEKALEKLDENFLKKFLGEEAKTEDLAAFSTPFGQAFFFWMYHSLNLHLVAVDEAMIEKINQVKDIFAHTLGNAEARAEAFKDKVLKAGTAVVFTQESDARISKALTEEGYFLSVESQNPLDGSFVFLKGDCWEPDYEVIDISSYSGFEGGKMNVILATQKITGQKFLLASCHGNSTDAEDGRLQISLVVDKFKQLSKEHKDLQLVIGTDANTKSEKDVEDFKNHLDTLGLVSTSVGPTTIKKRMVTVQHGKAGRPAIDEEDYLITLKKEDGGRFTLTHPTVGFKEESPDITQSLPNKENPSDHYPVGALLTPVDNDL